MTVRPNARAGSAPRTRWNFRGNGTKPNNLNSDFFYKRGQRLRDRRAACQPPPPHGPRPQIKALVRGYVDGYNRGSRSAACDRINDPRCKGQAWVRPITELDVYRRFYQLASLASQGVAIDGIGDAHAGHRRGRGQAQSSQPPRSTA